MYQPREDYNECLELALVFLQGANRRKIYNLRKCGAISKARYMAKLIYVLKIVLLWPLIKESGVLSEDEYQGIFKFVQFAVYIYLEDWFSAPLASQAPRNDLDLFQKCVHYKTVDASISANATKALQLHQWYLTEDLIGLSLFDERISDAERASMAKSHHGFITTYEGPKNRTGRGQGKPFLPPVRFSSELSDFVGPSSPILFKRLNIKHDFLLKPVGQWKKEQSYIDGKHTVYNLQVVNDLAERAVQLSAKYLGSATNEQNYRNNLQAVETIRKNKPILRCRKDIAKTPFDVLACNNA